MISKILIANRGEIACRVIKTAQRLSIPTVAVYSDADANALHVQMADEAVHVGAAPSRESYLDQDKIINAARLTGADAIHPGYGFLSENAEFCHACKAAGIIFIGPPPTAIEAMGSKSAAKQIMEVAGVPLVPGYHGDDQDPALLKQHAQEMGYPVLLKATAGGGGKGMRQVWSHDEFDEALASAKRESTNAFGDDKMLVEKYLTQPRHVEIQVFCDQLGNAVYLAERDCSVQRRHQKIIEEAPAPGISGALRAEMGEAAIASAKAIDYEGAGTVEFLLNEDGSFFFMEMNTRLQVEHPVTEMITGQDLVEWQIIVANGEPLPLQQADVQINGHAFEVRVYAEDPDNDFLPATGTLQHLSPPNENRYVRVDTGVVQGDEVSVYYDPMIAKLIVWDKDRGQALKRLGMALQTYQIAGVTTNIDFLRRLSASEPFAAANLDTNFISQHQDLLFETAVGDEFTHVAIAALYMVLSLQQNSTASAMDPFSPWNMKNAWRMNEACSHRLDLRLSETVYSVCVNHLESGYLITSGDQSLVATAQLDADTLQVSLDGHLVTVIVSQSGNSYTLFTEQGAVIVRQVLPDLGEEDHSNNDNALVAPMNGTIVSLLVEVGSDVAADEALLVMEAMKMEHVIRAPSRGKVLSFYFAPGDLVDGGVEMVEFEAQAENDAQ